MRGNFLPVVMLSLLIARAHDCDHWFPAHRRFLHDLLKGKTRATVFRFE